MYIRVYNIDIEYDWNHLFFFYFVHLRLCFFKSFFVISKQIPLCCWLFFLRIAGHCCCSVRLKQQHYYSTFGTLEKWNKDNEFRIKKNVTIAFRIYLFVVIETNFIRAELLSLRRHLTLNLVGIFLLSFSFLMTEFPRKMHSSFRNVMAGDD